MPRFFIPPEQFDGDNARVTGADHLHLARVLRAKIGDTLELLDDNGSAFIGTIVAIERNCTAIRIDGSAVTRPEPLLAITVAQALGKADKFEQVVQHGTEIGASKFVPVLAERCVANLRGDDNACGKLARWNQIAKDAAQQCGRCRIPAVSLPVKSFDLFKNGDGANCLATRTEQPEMRLVLHPDAEAAPMRIVLGNISNQPGRVTIAIGPEGGWSPSEVSAARGAGWLVVSVGPYVLRTETAALAAISRIMHCFEA